MHTCLYNIRDLKLLSLFSQFFHYLYYYSNIQVFYYNSRIIYDYTLFLVVIEIYEFIFYKYTINNFIVYIHCCERTITTDLLSNYKEVQTF